MKCPFLVGCVLVVISGLCQSVTGKKPEMFPKGDEILLKEGNELRIECYSKETKNRLQFSFPETTIVIPRSNYEILRTPNGTITFLRRYVIPTDTGWYACAEEGIHIDNVFRNLNHTHDNIKWIYVYVRNYLMPIPFGRSMSFSFPITLIQVAESAIIIPCRPSLPTTKVELWQNFKFVEVDGKTVRFDPKIGFIIKKVKFEAGEAVFQCGNLGFRDEYVVRYSSSKPTMTTANDKDLILQEGDELRIECYSETSVSFMFPNIISPNSSIQSEYEIFRNRNGSQTFLRRNVISEDTGWYGCAGDGIQNDIPYYSINYTRKEIDWIYVYVNSSVPIASGLMVYRDLWKKTIIPCRPTSPATHVQLSRMNYGILEPMDDLPFDPRLGFIYKRQPNYGISLYCTTDKLKPHAAKNYSLVAAEAMADKHPTPVITHADNPRRPNIRRMIGEDLHLVCEAFAPDIKVFGLEWTIPSAVSKDRVQYNHIQADGRFENNVYLKKKQLMITIKNISTTDSGEYNCLARTRAEYDPKQDWKYVEVF